MPPSAEMTLAPTPDVAPATGRILGICGSLRAGSYNRRLLQATRTLAPPDVELQLWDRLTALPPFSEDDEQEPEEPVLGLREAIAAADAVLIATPQYNASLPGQLKNALDWASRPYATNVLRGKPVAVIGASPSPSGAARAQSEARVVLSAIGADVLEEGLTLARAVGQFDRDGALTTLAHRLALTKIVQQLVARARNRELLAAA